MVGDLASGRSEVEALRRWRDRIRAARHNAMKRHRWQIDQGIVPPGPIIPGPGARLPASADAPPLCRSRTPAKAKSPGGKGVPLARSQTPGKSKGSGGKGRGRGSQSASKGGKKGAHPGRGEYSRYAGYSDATSDAVPSIQFQDSAPEGQAKGALPKGPPSASSRSERPSTHSGVHSRVNPPAQPGGDRRGTASCRSLQRLHGRFPYRITACGTQTSTDSGRRENSYADDDIRWTGSPGSRPRTYGTGGNGRTDRNS